MAIMIPEKPREFDPYSREGLMFQALEKLPDDYYVVHSLQINRIKDDNVLHDSEADFVVFHRKKGLLFIEAKATRATYRNGQWYYGNGDEMHSGGPFAQARRNMYAIKDHMKNLRMQSIIDNCKFLFAVWFPIVSADYVKGLMLPPDAPEELILTEEALYDPAPYLENIFSLLERGKETTNLSPSQAARIVNEILCPHFDIAPSASFDNDTKRIIFHRMLKEQASVLNFLDEQRIAVINGAAGTGKTLVAVEKAKRHAVRNEKVLFLCYNNQLKKHLSEHYAHVNIDYYTLAGYCCSLCRSAEPDYSMMYRILEEMWENHSFPYRNIIIDEGQDFGSEITEELDILEIMRMIIEDSEDTGSFYVFYDRLQTIQAYTLPKFLENADCKLTLYRNCRNTENIAKTSLRPLTDRAPKLMENCIVGVPAKLHFCTEAVSVRTAADEALNALVEDGISNIVILTCKTEADSILSPYLQKQAYHLNGKAYPFTTCRKFKGLEADAIILVDVDEETFTGESRNRQNVMLYYVGASRARLRLDILTTIDDEGCVRVLEKMGKAKSTKRPKRNFANMLNALPI